MVAAIRCRIICIQINLLYQTHFIRLLSCHMDISSTVFISDLSRLITCVITRRITHSAISSSALGSPVATKEFQISCLIVTNTDAPILREHEGTIRSWIIYSAEPRSISEIVFLASGGALDSVPVIVTGRERGGWRVTFVDPGINLSPGEQSRSPGSSSAQPPHAALEKEEEEGNHCCLATGGSQIIS